MTHRARILILPALFVLLAVPASAQKSGLEFGFPSGLGLDSIDPEGVEGYDFAWTWRDGGNRGLRVGLTLALEDLEGERTYEEQGDISYADRSDRTSSTSQYSLRLQKLFLTQPRRNIRAVFGVGPTASYSNFVALNPIGDLSRAQEIRNRTWAVGLAWDLGVEWELASQVSLGARYGWSLVYRSDREEVTSTYEAQDLMIRTTSELEGMVLSNRGGGELVASIWF